MPRHHRPWKVPSSTSNAAHRDTQKTTESTEEKHASPPLRGGDHRGGAPEVRDTLWNGPHLCISAPFQGRKEEFSPWQGGVRGGQRVLPPCSGRTLRCIASPFQGTENCSFPPGQGEKAQAGLVTSQPIPSLRSHGQRRKRRFASSESNRQAPGVAGATPGQRAETEKKEGVPAPIRQGDGSDYRGIGR